MKNLAVTLTLLFTSLALVACAHHDTFVKADDTALGRVVVYRNGIAFYERRAKAQQEALTLQVPSDKVDDFLKSLTVKDAVTGETVPVSYPTSGASDGSTVHMTIQLPRNRTNDVILTYITEAPAWKPSYRVVVKDDDTVGFQGWAIVDNTSGEDWKAVRVGVGSSSALSFRYDLRSVQNVHRETLGGAVRFAHAPPGGMGLSSEKRVAQLTFAEVAAEMIPTPEGHPDANLDFAESSMVGPVGDSGSGGIGSLGRGAGGGGMSPPPAAAVRRVRQEKKAKARVAKLAKKIKKLDREVTLSGYAKANEEDSEERSLDRANRLRNELIAQGVAPGRLRVVGHGHVRGKKGGVELNVHSAGAGNSGALESDEPVGESHFESTSPMTIARGTSAMVSMVNTDTPGEVVYLYAPDAERGHERYAFRAVRFHNPTDSSLEPGPVTVYGEGRFVGEGLSEAVPPGATSLVPFALDRQVVVERKGHTKDRIARLTKVHNGVCTAEVQHTRRSVLTVSNRLSSEALVYIRHEVPEGWDILKSPAIKEKMGRSHLFVVKMGAGETREVEISEATPLSRTIDLRSQVGVDLMRTYLSASSDDAEFTRSMKGLLTLHDDVTRNQEMIVSLQERNAEYRQRLNELHIQIASLRLVKAGNSLLRHLRKKMKDMSERVQEATIKIVNHQEQLMLARIRFQDGISELSLEKAAVAQVDTTEN